MSTWGSVSNTWADKVSDGTGDAQALLVIEGFPYSFCTGSAPMASLIGSSGSLPTQLDNTLDPQSVKWEFGVDVRNLEPAMPGITFQLRDIDGPDHARNVITRVFTDRASIVRTNLAAATTRNATTITVDSTLRFASSGTFYLDQEAISYTNTNATQFLNCTRGRYYSSARTHEFLASPVQGASTSVPLVTSAPLTIVGRKVRLFMARILSDGSTGTATCVWRGRITGAPRCKGKTWALTCESIWDAINQPILADAGRSTLAAAIVLAEDEVVDWHYSTGDPATGAHGLTFGDTFTVPAGTFASLEDLLSSLTAYSNAAFDPVLFVLAGAQINFSINAGHVEAEWVSGEDSDAGFLSIHFSGPVLAKIFGATDIVVPPRLTAGSTSKYRSPERAPACFIPASLAPFTVPVNDCARFNAVHDDGVGWGLYGIVRIGETYFYLDGVVAVPGPGDLTLRAITADAHGATIFAAYGEDVQVTQCFLVSGDLIQFWKDAFIDCLDLKDATHIGVDSDDFDWDAMEDFAVGNGRRVRILDPDKKETVRDLLLEDMRPCGLMPTIGTEGRIMWRPLVLPTKQDVELALDETLIRDNSEPTVDFVPGRPITRVEFEASNDVISGFIPWKAVFESRTSIGLLGSANTLTIKTGGFASNTTGSDLIIAAAISFGTRYLSFFQGDTAEARVPATIKAANLVPMDVVTFSHPTLPNLTDGTRGIDGQLAFVTGIAIAPFATDGTVVVRLIYQLTGPKTGLIGPAAQLDSSTSLGGTEYRLDLANELAYSTRAAGLYFDEGAKVKILRWDGVLTGTVQWTGEVIAPGHNAAGTSVYVDFASMPTIVSGNYILVFDSYDATDQLAAVQETYVFIGDETDFEIGTSGDEAFKPS